MNEIMLIDDDRATNYLSQYVIDELGCCENLSIHDMAQDALDDIQSRLDRQSPLPDVIFLDLNMPRICLLYTSPSPRDRTRSRMPSSA